jgi:hypothetical protein
MLFPAHDRPAIQKPRSRIHDDATGQPVQPLHLAPHDGGVVALPAVDPGTARPVRNGRTLKGD